MSVHTRSTDFLNAAREITDPALNATEMNRLAEIAAREEFDRQNGDTAHLYIKGNQRRENSANSESAHEKEKRDQRYAQQITNITLGSTSFLDRINASFSTLKNWLTQDTATMRDVHEQASREVTVPRNQVLYNSAGGIANAEEKARLEQQGEFCSALKTSENLYYVDGKPFTDTHGNFYDAAAHGRMTDALKTMQENTALLEQLERGEITFEEMDPEKRMRLIAAQPDNVREKIYADAGFSKDEIAEIESHANPHPTSLLDQISDPRTAMPDVIVNGGDIKPGQLTSSFGFAGGLLKPMESLPISPAFALQNKLELSLNN